MLKMQKNIWILIIVIIILVLLLFIFLRDKDKNTNKVVKDIISKNTLRFSVSGGPVSLDPNFITDVWGSRIVINLFEGLTVRGIKGNIAPGVAKSWKVSEDGKEYTFYLREDTKWSDNTPLTAEDFVFSIKRVLHPDTKSLNASLFYIIKGAKEFNMGKAKDSVIHVQALDKYTLKITLISKAPYFLELISHPAFLPIPKHIVLKYGPQWHNVNTIVSNGPYKILESKPKKYILAVKNPYYWDISNVKVANVKFYISDDKELLLKKYINNEIDIFTNLSGEICKWASENIASQLKVFPSMSTYYYLVNSSNEKLKNPKVRLALNMSIDRNMIVQKILMLPDTPVAYTLIPSNIPNYTSPLPCWANWSMDKRIKESTKLLKEAGYDKNNPLVFSISYNVSDTNKQIALAVAAMWKNIGVNAALLSKPPNAHFYDILLGNYELAKSLWIADYNEPSTFIRIFSELKHQHLDFNHKQYSSEYLAAIYANNPKDAMYHYKNAESILLNSNTIIPLYNSLARVLIKPWVKGYETNHMDTHLIKYMSISQQ